MTEPDQCHLILGKW